MLPVLSWATKIICGTSFNFFLALLIKIFYVIVLFLYIVKCKEIFLQRQYLENSSISLIGYKNYLS
jgi:hypothetical protein